MRNKIYGPSYGNMNETSWKTISNFDPRQIPSEKKKKKRGQKNSVKHVVELNPGHKHKKPKQ